MYYGLFHRLAAEGASVFEQGGPALAAQVARAYNHGAMRKVCEEYVRTPGQPFRPPLHALATVPPDKRIIEIASAFIRLQVARHDADYDLAKIFEHQAAVALLEVAELAHWNLDEVRSLPETATFLTALLLADRWTRRG